MRWLTAFSAGLVALAWLTACGKAPAMPPVPPSQTHAPIAPTRAIPTVTASSRPPERTVTAIAVGPRRFSIVSDGTVARFRIREILRGKSHVVVGRTDRVHGDFEVDRNHPGSSTVGPIVIEAGGFATDDELRDSSVRGLILEAGTYPEIVFTPIAIEGLPETVAVGDRLAFDITGDLQIRHISRRATLHVVVDVLSADRVTGTASGTIRRPDFDLTIPSVPGVAEVGQEVELSLEFVAEDAGPAE